MKHTPGPWKVLTANPSVILITHNTLQGICEIPPTEQGLANAKLIAAAPELLEQLHLMIMAGQEALDYKDGSGRPILQEAIWRAQDTLKKVMKKS
jgi:hypothetical protein